MYLGLVYFICAVIGLWIAALAGGALIGNLYAYNENKKRVIAGVFYGLIIFLSCFYPLEIQGIHIVSGAVFLFAILPYEKYEIIIAAIFYIAGAWLGKDTGLIALLLVADVFVILAICRERNIARFIILCTLIPIAFSENILYGTAGDYEARVIWSCGIILQLLLMLGGFYMLIHRGGRAAAYFSQYIHIFRGALDAMNCFIYKNKKDVFVFSEKMKFQYELKSRTLKKKEWAEIVREASTGGIDILKKGVQKSFFLSGTMGRSRYVYYGYFPLWRGAGVGFLRDATDEISPQELTYFRIQRNQQTGFLTNKMFPEYLYRSVEKTGRSYYLAVIELTVNIPGYSIYDVELETKCYKDLMKRAGSLYKDSEIFSVLSDEYILAVPFDGHGETAGKIYKQLEKFFEGDFELDGRKVSCFARIGSHCVYAENIKTYEDASLYNDELLFCMTVLKKNSRLTYYRFREEDYEQYVEKMRRVRYLNNIIKSRKLKIVFQPVVDVSSGRPVMFEVLTRVEHEEYKNVSQFFDDCIEFSMETEVDYLVHSLLREALESGEIPPYNYSVNLSGKTRIDENMVFIADFLHKHGFKLYIELVERTEHSLKSIEEREAFAKKHHAALTADDYGMQHSRLEILSFVNFSVIKIPREFVANVDNDEKNRMFVVAIFGLAESSGMMCIAEGAERQGEVEALKDIGIKYIQGYYFAKPETCVAPEHAYFGGEQR